MWITKGILEYVHVIQELPFGTPFKQLRIVFSVVTFLKKQTFGTLT
jgi:hypothetical protein